jgi:hypothetical protein
MSRADECATGSLLWRAPSLLQLRHPVTSLEVCECRSMLSLMRTSAVSTSNRTFGWWLAAGVLACASILYVLAWNMYPVPDGDAIFFVPAIRSYAVTGVVENKALDMSYATDPRGLGRYLFYPPMFMVIVGGVARCLGMTGYPGILMVLATMRVASVAMFAIAVHRLARRRYGDAVPPMVAVVALLLVASNGLFLLASNGRPEVLTILLASIAILVAVAESTWKEAILPLLVGMTFSFSIASGVIAFAIYAVYLCFAEQSCTRRFLLATVAGVLMIVLFLAGYPVAGIDGGDGIAGIGLHSKIEMARRDTSIEMLFSYWKSWFLFFAVACIVVARRLFRRVAELPGSCSWIQSVAAVLLFVATILFFGVRVAPAHYNVYAFVPIYQTLAFAGFVACDSRAGSAAGRGRGATYHGWPWLHPRNVRGAFLGLLVLAACLACRDTAIRLLTFPYYLSSGCDYRSMKEVFAQVLAKNPGTYFYSGGLQMLDDDLAGSVFRIDEHGRCTSLRAEHDGQEKQRSLVFVEERNGYPVPPHLRTIVSDATDKGLPPPPIRGLRILRSRQGYSFMAFEQESDDSIRAARP